MSINKQGILNTLTVDGSLLPVPPQTHDDEDQQDEDHDGQNTAHNQVEQAPCWHGGRGQVRARRGDGVFRGCAWGLAGCRRVGGDGS